MIKMIKMVVIMMITGNRYLISSTFTTSRYIYDNGSADLDFSSQVSQ
jgi:hypothetical protein